MQERTEIKRAVPIRLPLSLWPRYENATYEPMALSGVQALKIARYLLQYTRERFVERSEVVKATDVGAFNRLIKPTAFAKMSGSSRTFVNDEGKKYHN